VVRDHHRPTASVSQPGLVESFSSKEGLSADAIACLFEDREGNIWVATFDGLDRFRQVDVNRVQPSDPSYTVSQSRLLAGSGKQMIVAAPGAEGGLLVLTPDGAIQTRLARHRKDAPRPSRGKRWRAPGRRHSGLAPTEDGTEKTIPACGHGAGAPGARGGARARWRDLDLGRGRRRLQYQQNQWRRHTGLPGAGMQAAMAPLADSKGRLWVGYQDNKIVMLENGKVHTYAGAQG
jgi:ligand-binding sensor domain-containing protein